MKTETLQITVIIVNYNVYADVLSCIESIYKNVKTLEFEIIVVDNNSPDRSISGICNFFKDVKLIPLHSNNGFGYANNVGMKAAKGKYFLLVNPDIVFQSDTIEKLYYYLEENHNVGVAGPVQKKPGAGIEYYYTFFPSFYSRFAQEFGMYMKAPIMRARFYNFWDNNIKLGKPFKVDWVIGSCMMVRKEIFDTTRGFNEAFFLYEEETEWQYRMNKSKWSSVILPYCMVIHNHHSSTGKFGKIFIYFHEFRSRIVFSNLHDKIILRILRKVVISGALALRLLVNSLKYIFTGNMKFKNKISVFYTILRFNLKSRYSIINDRYKPEDFKNLFNV